MITTIDKAIAALIPPVLFLASNLFGWEINLSAEIQTTIAGVLSAILVYLVPNRRA